MRLAVSSSEPDEPLETAVKVAPKHPYRGFGGSPRVGLEAKVRGNLERIADMHQRLAGIVSQWFKHSASRDSDFLRGKHWSFTSVMALGLAVFLVAGAGAHAQSAGTWNSRGQKAEAREDYDAAFESYRQAHLKKPRDLQYRTRYERLRYTAANMHVDRGRVLKQSGDMGGAVNEFARALQIDPGNQVAAQELQVMENQGGSAGTAPGTASNGVSQTEAAGGAGASPGKTLIPGLGEQTPHQTEVQKEIESMDGPVAMQPVSDDPITLHMVEDTKVVYQAICKAAGLNVIFDPDYVGKRIPVDLNSVSLPDALHIVEVLSGTFWKPITSNTIFVAQNTRTKRTDLDDLAVQTFYLTNVSQQNDANEIMVAIRNLLDPGLKIYLVASQNALVIRATPDELILAEKLINDLDRTRPEVVVDVAVLEVNRQLERNLGITLPTSFGLTPQASNANSTTSTGTAPVTNNGVPNTTPTSGITLNTLGNLNATNFAVSITGGTVNALLSDSDTRILQNPRIRATDGQHSTLKIGSKIPVATGSFSAGAAIPTAGLGVQTQFTYLDVGVNIDITPTVHFDREVSLKLKIEISSQNGSVTITGVTEPIISQRVAEQVIQLKDGEPAILAGLLQQQDSKNVSGTPGLGELPFLKYFFSSTDKTQQSDEIVFLIIPHIVRESILTDQNTRAIYTGTSQAVQLIRKEPSKMVASDAGQVGGSGGAAASSQPTSAANAASAMIGKMAADARPVTPDTIAAARMAPNGTVSDAPVTLSVVPAAVNQTVGSTFQVSVVASNAHDLFAAPLQMQFDPRVLTLVNVDSGDLLSRDGQAVALVHRDEGNGAVTVSATRPPGTKGIDGQGTVCTFTFKALTAGDATLALTRIGLKDSQQKNIASVGGQTVVHVK